ncbi:MAG: carboxypeptidase regulatory-like domain-containing protein [Planctomycetia bacterium]|nr:carboxypeptidase regulatory-like domain-containing protein [Planctomycetia bacterium]
MWWIDASFDRLVTIAAVCFVVLGVGAFLARWLSRPIERLRAVQATLVALALVCTLQILPIIPQITLTWLPDDRPAAVPTTTARANLEPIVERTPFDSGERTAPAETPSIGIADIQPSRVDRASGNWTAAVDVTGPPGSGSASTPQAPPGRGIAGYARFGVVGVFLAGAMWSLVTSLVGLVRLRRLVLRSQPAESSIKELLAGIQGAQRRPAKVLRSADVSVPLTFGIFRPMIVLPAATSAGDTPEATRYALAHEWAHILRYDIANWWAARAFEPVVWFQPAYWILRRELRVCQDQLADQFAANLSSDPISYAELLLSMARARREASMALALSMSSGRSSLHRRIVLLLSANRGLASIARPWLLLAAVVAIAAVSGVAGIIRLDRAAANAIEAGDPAPPIVTATEPATDTGAPAVATAPAETPSDPKAAASSSQTADEKKPDEAPATSSKLGPQFRRLLATRRGMVEEQPDGSLVCSGYVIDKKTKDPLRDVQVTVRRSINSTTERKTLEETTHPTDADGKYTFVISPAQVAERMTYIELDVAHPDYAPQSGFGYSLAMILKNIKLGEPPFFTQVTMDKAAPLTGRVISPDGTPLADVAVLGYSKTGVEKPGEFEYGSFAKARSAADGTFRLNFVEGGPSVFWIVPEKHAPRQILSGTKRGDWGDVRMEAGVAITGQVVDAEGKPVAGVWVTLSDEQSQREIQMPVASALNRSAQTDAEGHFALAPLKPGPYVLFVDEYPHEIRYERRGEVRVKIPAVFPRRKVTIGDAADQPLLVQAVPHVRFRGQYLDSKGAPSRGHEVMVFGRMDGEFYHTQLRPDAEGRIEGMLPHGLTDARIDIITNEHSSLRFRIGKDKPLEHGRNTLLGTIEDDVLDVEVIRYKAPIALLKPVDEEGRAVSGVKVAGIYEADNKDKLVQPVGGRQTSIHFEKQPDGRFRSEQWLPDEPTRFVVSAEGYEEAEETLSLPEGEQKELVLVMKKRAAAAQEPTADKN